MKQKDIVLIMVMVFIGAVVALVISKFVFSSPKNKQQTAEIVDVITADFPSTPDKYYNINSVNPTKQIEIGAGTNPNPFNGKPQQ